MAKPVVRSNWKIDPAELALAQERTEARLSDLFDHATGRWAGRRPPIVVDGVELIGSAEAAPVGAAVGALPADLVASGGSTPARDAVAPPPPIGEGMNEAAAPGLPGDPPLAFDVGTEPTGLDLGPEAIRADGADEDTGAPMDPEERERVGAVHDVTSTIDDLDPAGPGMADVPPAAAAVRVLDLPGPDLVTVAFESSSSDQLVGVMSHLDEAAAEPRQLRLVVDSLPPVSEGEPAVAGASSDDAPLSWTSEDDRDMLAVIQIASTFGAEPAPGPATETAPAEQPSTRSRSSRPTVSAKAPRAARAGGAPTRAARAARPDRAGRSGTRRDPAAGASPAPRATRPPLVAAPSCPYCAVLLDPPPTASRRCARCRQHIVVKRVDGRLAFLTEAAVAVFEAERQKEAAAARLGPQRERWLRLAATAGATPSRFRRLAAVPVSDEVVEAARDLYMTTVEQAFLAARRERRWEDAAEIRRGQALAVHRLAGSPIPPSEDVVALCREGVASQLEGLAEIAREAELVGSDCCDPCRDGSGQAFSIAEELAAPRLPHAGCPKGLCRCGWDLAARDREAILRYLRRHPRPTRTVTPGGAPPVAPSTDRT